MSGQVLVIGLGNPDRGDDAVGVEIARQVAADRPDLSVLEFDDPSEALDAWDPEDTVVVTDAIMSGGHLGDIHVVDAVNQKLPTGRWCSGGTHALGLAAVVELARALGQLPRRLVVVGVEAKHFAHGAPLSAAVASAVPEAVAAVHAAIDDVIEDLVDEEIDDVFEDPADDLGAVP
jgi:hydrogenase maturation protease